MCVCVFVPRERKSEGTFFIVIRRIMDGNGIGLERTVIIFRMVTLMVKEKECIVWAVVGTRSKRRGTGKGDSL